MAEKKATSKTELPIVQLLPNLLTIGAICAGLTAIRLGLTGDFERAVMFILVACVLDGVDGRLARLLKCESKMGAELDSLADFVNFGIAPPLLIYVWALQDLSRVGWISVLFFSVCSVIRLARFNVDLKSDEDKPDSNYFVGVPSPAGALLVMFPMFASFLFDGHPIVPPEVISAYMAVIGLLMISRIPTWSFKVLTISRDKVKYLFVGFVLAVAALLTYPWITLVVFDLVYVAGVVWAWKSDRNSKAA